MSDDKKGFPRDFTGDQKDEPAKKPDPLDDVREGLGLLFRAAKSTIEKLPTKDLERGVSDGVQEVGKAIGRVVDAIGKELAPKAQSGQQTGETAAPPTHPQEGSPPTADPQVRVADEKNSVH